MKKVTLLGIVIILLAAAVVPVMAAGPGNSHGNGNGNNPGQGNNTGTQEQIKEQNHDQIKLRNRDLINNPGINGNGNQVHMSMRTPFYLQGTITAIDAGAQSVTVNLYHGNAQVRQYLGMDLVLQSSDSTQIFKITQGNEAEGTSNLATSSSNADVTPGNRVSISFDQLEVGQKVAIHGNVADNLYQARLITVYIHMPLGQPAIIKP
jgi:hypothetical protein